MIYLSNMFKEFVTFIKEYKIFSLAIAFVMGTASTALVNSMVKDVFMPLLSPLISTALLRDAVWEIGPSKIAIGSFFAELLNFIILAFIVFVIAKKIVTLGKVKN